MTSVSNKIIYFFISHIFYFIFPMLLLMLFLIYYPADIDLNDHTRAVSGAKEFFMAALSDLTDGLASLSFLTADI